MGAAFGGGVAFSLIGGMGAGAAGANSAGPLQQAFSTGVVFALFQGALAKVRCVCLDSPYAAAIRLCPQLGGFV